MFVTMATTKTTKTTTAATTIRISTKMISLWCLIAFLSSAAIAASPPLLLRIRQKDGALRRVVLTSGPEDVTLSQLLLPSEAKGDTIVSSSSSSGGNVVLDATKTLTELRLNRNGTLLTLSSAAADETSTTNERRSSTSLRRVVEKRFDPYPDLAKRTSYRRTKALLRARGESARSSSYADVERLRDAMHRVDVGGKSNAAKRAYMCGDAAARFRASCGDGRRQRAGLLLGTVATEREDRTNKGKSRTSLSSTTESEKRCKAVRVHAVWDPSTSSGTRTKPNAYDTDSLRAACDDDDDGARELSLAARLGLRPVGWIYSYADSETRREAELPVLARDVHHGARLQASVMRRRSLSSNEKDDTDVPFVTLAMDAATGAAEAFQLVDAAVQAVAEGVLSGPSDDDAPEERNLRASDPVLVDGQETQEVDSVLCLVNTAVLSHKGRHCVNDASAVLTKKGALTGKIKRQILSALTSGGKEDALRILCDFQVLCGLDRLLGKSDMDELIELVSLYARGQKKSTKIGSRLRLQLEGVLGG